METIIGKNLDFTLMGIKVNAHVMNLVILESLRMMVELSLMRQLIMAQEDISLIRKDKLSV